MNSCMNHENGDGPSLSEHHLTPLIYTLINISKTEKGWRVLFARTSDLVQRLQVARRELALEAAINRLDHFDVLILDDLAYVIKDQAETSALFELISTRYERRSMIITANQPFGEWGKVFQDPAMTLAAVDRLVHHSTVRERAVRMVQEHRGEYPSLWAALESIAPKIGCVPQTLR